MSQRTVNVYLLELNFGKLCRVPHAAIFLGMHPQWRNGSLGEQIWTNRTLPLPEANHVNITIFSDSRASLDFFLTSTQSVHATFALANTLLSSDFYSITIGCVYPVSGTYSFSARILFYGLLLFALLWRRHGWLAVAALASAMTYSATTAVHALALVSQFGWTLGPVNLKSSQPFGDLDIQAIYPILTASLIMITPILNWSTSVRRDKAQIIIVLWGILTLMAWVPVIVYIGATPSGEDLHPWGLNPIRSLLMCPWSAIEIFPSCGLDMDFSLEDYQNCQCFDFCGVLGPPAPMRSGAKLVPYLYSSRRSITARGGAAFVKLYYYSQVVAITIVVYGIFGLILHQFSLREIRDIIFTVCDAHPREQEAIWVSILYRVSRSLCHISNREIKSITYNTETARSFTRKAQYWLAKSLATTLYSLGLLLAFICPPVFVAAITVIELDMVVTPLSENSDAVGAWSPWVGTTFIILVAAILRLQDAWELTLMSFSKKVLGFVGLDGSKICTKESRHCGHFWQRFTRFLLFYLCSAVDHVRYSTRTAINTTLFTCQEFSQWISSPIPHPYTCGCGGCVARRTLDQAARLPAHQAHHNACQSCMNMKNREVEIFHAHIEAGKACGCRVCWSARQEAADTKMRKEMERAQQARDETKGRRRRQFWRVNGIDLVPKGTGVLIKSKDYKTLGVRILQMFAAGIDDRLIETDSTHSS